MRFRLHIDPERCKGCGLCVEVCRKGLLALAKTLNTRGQHYVETADRDACDGCRRCTLVCPDNAIEIEKRPDQPEKDDT
jgi:2-oxoglutarate ferredoxin oxidoreductase subunit delta